MISRRVGTHSDLSCDDSPGGYEAPWECRGRRLVTKQNRVPPHDSEKDRRGVRLRAERDRIYLVRLRGFSPGVTQGDCYEAPPRYFSGTCLGDC